MPTDRGWTMDEILARRFPSLPDVLAPYLAHVPPSKDGELRYYPCVVTLSDGRTRDFVYLTEARQWLRMWGGPSPDKPLGPRFIDVRDIVSIRESPSRLPPSFADKLYAVGETGMGYSIFTVCFDDGSTAAFSGGNAVDFIWYPDGKTAANVVDVLPHVGLDHPGHRLRPEHYWCIFERDEAVSSAADQK